jgi:hypothetical protein
MEKPTTPSSKNIDRLSESRDSDGSGLSSIDLAPVLLEVGPSTADKERPTYIEDPTYLSEQPPAFSTYSAQQHVNGDGQVISHDLHLNSDAEALYQWLHSCAQTEPRQLLEIKGSDDDCDPDFHMMFDLSSFFKAGYELGPAMPLERRMRGTNVEREATDGEVEARMDVRAWCDAYIRNPAHLKEFKLRKRLERLDRKMIETHVRSLVRSTKYQGRVEIRFPIQKCSVVLSPDNWVCRVRYGWARWLFYLSFLWIITLSFLWIITWPVLWVRYGWARWLFYLSFLWIITWPVLWVFTKRWDVIDAVYQCETDAQIEWIHRWGWVITCLVRKRRVLDVPLTVADLEWHECKELEEQRSLEARSTNRSTGSRDWLRSLGDGVEGSRA